jgi:hypothetical protein
VRDYQACVGSLMYLSVYTRGDCSYSVNQSAKFMNMNNPGPTHIAAAKRILRYLAGTKSLGITYRRSDNKVSSNTLTVSSNADHAGGDDRRSVSGWAVMLNGAMISWSSKRQPVTAISSTESEFYAVSQCSVECILEACDEHAGIYATGSNSYCSGQLCVYLSDSRSAHVSQS